MPTVVTGLAWIWLFNVDFGLINFFLIKIAGIRGPNWLGSERMGQARGHPLRPLGGLGGGVFIFLAALQSVPVELYEAAELEGANLLGRFWNVTVPMISPMILYNLMIAKIFSLRVFTRIYVVTQGGPNYGSYFYNLICV